MASWRTIVGCIAALLAAGCSYPTRNEEARTLDEFAGYRLQNLAPKVQSDTLVIVTASGGGTRATALTLSVLRALDRIALPSGRTLAQEVDVISSVSGGSVAAAQFALRGRDGFDTLEHDFIRRDGIGTLLTAGLNPYGLARLSTPGTERIDLLIDHLDGTLFHGARYQDLLDSGRRPYLLLNAADMVEGLPFPFTRRKFDLLCSDLERLPVATAVAASAAFPVALSPVTLTNYQPCAANAGKVWPKAWVTSPLEPLPETFSADGIWYNSPQRVAIARSDLRYAIGRNAPEGQQKRYVHLLDGGIADNLGVFEPYRMLTTWDTEHSIFGDVGSGKIKKLVIVVVNARSFASSTLDEDRATPGIVDMLKASINAPLDRTTAATAGQLRGLFQDTFRNINLNDRQQQARFRDLATNTALISVDFDAIPDADCRRKFHGIATSWTLPPAQIDAVLRVGGALLAYDPNFADLLRLTGGTPSGLPTLQETCAAIGF